MTEKRFNDENNNNNNDQNSIKKAKTETSFSPIDVASAIIEKINNATTCLEFKDQDINPFIDNIIAVLKKDSFTELNLINTKLNETNLDKLFVAIKDSKNINKLNLQGNLIKLYPKVNKEIIERLKNIEVLLTTKNLTDLHLACAVKTILRNNILQKEIENCLQNNSTLKELTLDIYDEYEYSITKRLDAKNIKNIADSVRLKNNVGLKDLINKITEIANKPEVKIKISQNEYSIYVNSKDFICETLAKNLNLNLDGISIRLQRFENFINSNWLFLNKLTKTTDHPSNLNAEIISHIGSFKHGSFASRVKDIQDLPLKANMR